MPKVHKNKIPIPLRLVVSTVNTPMYALGKLVAKCLSSIAKKVPTYIKDSDHLIKRMKELGPI